MDENHEPGIVGRASKFEAIRTRLETDDVRVLTLRGPGGVGKTTLARAFATEGEAPFVELDVCETADDIATAIGDVLSLPDVVRTIEGIRETLDADDVELVVLDNAEHIVDEVARVVGEWLEGTSTRFLITSRERTRVPGETIVDVAPLSDEDARRLFALRAREVVPEFRIDETNSDDVDRLVRLLEGLPLAVELAAARVRILSPGQICERLDRQFELLKNRADETGRHATLDACVEWSWAMLGDELRDVLTQAAIFRGRFTIEEAERVVSSDSWVGEALEGLVERSLVRVDRDGDVRFSLYDSVRRFVARRTEVDDELLERYLQYFLERATDRELRHADLVNVAFAIDRGIERRPKLAIDLLVEARQRLWRGGFITRLVDLLDRALALPDLPRVRRARLLSALASTHYARMKYEECDAVFAKVAELIEDETSEEALGVKARVAMMRGIRANETHQPDRAAREFERARLLMVHLPAHEQAHILAASGLATFRRHEFQKGIALFDEAIEAARKSGETALQARTLSWSALGHLAAGNVELAIDRLEESLELFGQCDDVVSLTQAQYTLAQALLASDRERATEMARAAVASSDLGRLRILQATTRVLLARIEGSEDAVSTIRRALRVFGDDTSHSDRWAVWLSLVVVLVRQGEFDLAAREMAELLKTVRRVGTDEEEATCRRYLAAIHMLRGKPAEADEATDDTFFEALARAVDNGGSLPEDRAAWHNPYELLLHDYCPTPLELYDEGLATRNVETLVLLDDGGTAILPDGTEIDLESRYVLRRLMAALCDAHDERRGETMTLDELVESGWPDETMTYESGIRRVYSAIRNLRKLGLDEIVLTGENGYLIDPDLAIERR